MDIEILKMPCVYKKFRMKWNNSSFYPVIAEESTKGKEKYTIKVKTSDKNNAAPKGDAWISLRGKQSGKSKKLRLEHNARRNKTLIAGEVGEFKVTCNNLGALEEITLGLYGKNS